LIRVCLNFHVLAKVSKFIFRQGAPTEQYNEANNKICRMQANNGSLIILKTGLSQFFTEIG
jgi:hypothetical protein